MQTVYSGDVGELIHILYEELLAMYGDEELAAVATAAVVNDHLSAQSSPLPQDPYA